MPGLKCERCFAFGGTAPVCRATIWIGDLEAESCYSMLHEPHGDLFGKAL